MTKEADLDLCGDETSWAHAGYCETETGVTSKIKNKPGVSKGGQTVVVSDVSRNRLRAYVHCHKMIDLLDGVTAKGQAEVINIAQKIEKMVIGSEREEEKESEKKYSNRNHVSHMTIFFR